MNRRNFLGRLSGVAALSVYGQASAKSNPDAPLPEDAANRLAVNFRQAGREIEIRVANPKGRWVVTAMKLKFEYEAAPRRSTPTTGRGEISGFYPNPDARTWPMHLIPGTHEVLHMRLGDTSILAGLYLLEVRGRERTLFEAVQSCCSQPSLFRSMH